MRAVRSVPAVVAVVLALGTACAQPPVLPASPAASAAPATAAAPPADGPSEQATMLCANEAQEDIALALGVDPTSVGPLKYADHTTTCRYAYPNGSFTLVIQELSDDLSTTKAYEALAAKLGRTQTIDLPGAQAFLTTGGSAVLRKDFKVLLVDVTALPATFGQPPVPRVSAAQLVMKAALGCWTG